MAERMNAMDMHLDEDLIFGLAEGGLDAAARASAEAHLQNCAACRREVEAAAGYFKEIAGLEPVVAPANFLANVRARLPRQSPLRAFLDVFMRPLRLIPIQVALLTILGLTAISSYLYQRGGLNKEAGGLVSESPAQPPAESGAETVAGTPEPMPRSPASASESAERPAATASPKKSSQAPRPLRKQSRTVQALPEPKDAYAFGGRRAGNRAKAVPKAESESRSDESMRDSKSSFAQDRAAPASAPSYPTAPAPLPTPAPVSPKAEPPAPVAEMETAPAEKTRAAKEPEAKTAVKEKKLDAKGGSGKRELADTEYDEEAQATRAPGYSGAVGAAEPPEFIVRLAPGKRAGDAVSGLMAMGADSLSAGTAGDSGGKGMDYRFQIPASMRKDIAPYLERYGKVERTGPLPAAGSASSRIRIRFLY
jgi:putative zinc finger protein